MIILLCIWNFIYLFKKQWQDCSSHCYCQALWFCVQFRRRIWDCRTCWGMTKKCTAIDRRKRLRKSNWNKNTHISKTSTKPIVPNLTKQKDMVKKEANMRGEEPVSLHLLLDSISHQPPNSQGWWEMESSNSWAFTNHRPLRGCWSPTPI